MDDLTWSTPIDRSLLIRDGNVNCPRQGFVDVEECLFCGSLLGIEGQYQARIVCGWPLDIQDRAREELASGRRWSRGR
jgi:hypothetical protein